MRINIAHKTLLTIAVAAIAAPVFAADTTAPTINSITRHNPTAQTTNAEEVTFRVIFSEEVVNVNTGDFALSGTGATGSSIESVTAISQSVYDVVADTGDGELNLVVRTASDNIEDLAGNDYDDNAASTEGYIIQRAPTITIDADTKQDTQAVSDVEITVEDDTAITKTNVTVDSSSTVTATELTCEQTTGKKVECTVTVDGVGDLVIRAEDDAGNVTTTAEEDFDIDDNVDVATPRYEYGSEDDEKLSKRSRNYATSKSVKFSGEIEVLKGGEVKIYDNKKKLATVSISSSTGKWSKSISFKNGKTYDLKFKFYDKHDTKVAERKTYELRVDTEDPKFIDIPSKLTKSPGARIWWEATDNHKIKRYAYYWNGKKTKTRDPQFFVPAGTPRGTYDLEIRAYDKAGNKSVKKVTVNVR